MATKTNPIKPGLIDELLAGRDPKTLFESEGLLDELKKALAERHLVPLSRRCHVELAIVGIDDLSTDMEAKIRPSHLFEVERLLVRSSSCTCKRDAALRSLPLLLFILWGLPAWQEVLEGGCRQSESGSSSLLSRAKRIWILEQEVCRACTHLELLRGAGSGDRIALRFGTIEIAQEV